MKTIYKTIYIFTAIFFFVGCFELDKFPLDQPSSESFWQNDDQAKMGIIGVYSKMKAPGLFGSLYILDCLTDIGMGYGYYGYEAISTGVYNNRSEYVKDKWKSAYDAIMGANDVIRNVSQSKNISDEVRTTVIAEAKFLRALFYFHLINFYGGVPIYDESIVLENDYNNLLNKRSSIEETRAFILKDLNMAIAELPVKWDNGNYGRATKGAAYALRGKVLLFAKEYEKASKDFEEIVQNSGTYGYGIYPEYAKLFLPSELGGADQSCEMIFSMQNIGGVGLKLGLPLCKFMGTRSSFGYCWNTVMPSLTLGDMYELKNGKKFNWDDFIPGFTTSQEVRYDTFWAVLTKDKKKIETYPKNLEVLLNMYEERDPRMKESIIFPYTKYLGWTKNKANPCLYAFAKGVHESKGFIRHNRGWYCSVWRKFVPEADMNGLLTSREHTPINFPIIRYADVLLMLAECKNEMGKYDDAVNYINQVRQRPSTNMPALNSGEPWLEARDKESIFKRIVHERAVEFAAEGLRFNDIRRWELAESLLNGKEEKGLMGDKAYYTRIFLKRDYLWPIPAQEIEINPDLTQNPDWY